MEQLRNKILSLKNKPEALKLIKGIEIGALCVVIGMFFVEFTLSNPLGHSISKIINDIGIIVAIITGCILDYVQYEKLRPIVIIGCIAIIVLIVI